jgi:NAD(P)H-dependent flavin oxidoreductase YrpB (nitropropane dioxygenase family)
MKNQVTEMFGIDMPIFAFTHCRDVVAAVTKSGGLGVLGAVGLSPRQLEIDLQWIEEEVGGKPYGVDLIVPAGRAPPILESDLRKVRRAPTRRRQ